MKALEEMSGRMAFAEAVEAEMTVRQLGHGVEPCCQAQPVLEKTDIQTKVPWLVDTQLMSQHSSDQLYSPGG